MKTPDYKELYDQKFKEIYENGLEEFKLHQERNEGLAQHHVVSEFLSELTQQQYELRYNTRGSSFRPDPFIEELLPEFKNRDFKYVKNHISFFLKRDLPKLKEKYFGKLETLSHPKIFNISDRELIEFLAHYFALESLKSYIAETEEEANGNSLKGADRGELTNVEKYRIIWTNRNNKNDFVKIIYALHHAGLINNGNGEVTKIIEYLNDIFNVGLSKNWQSNFSKSRNDQNNDYDHTGIFDKLKNAYLDYIEKKQ